MDKFVIAAIITGLFVLAKVIEAKFVKKDAEAPLRKVGKDGMLVYAASIAGLYVGEQFIAGDAKSGSPGAYIGTPEF